MAKPDQGSSNMESPGNSLKPEHPSPSDLDVYLPWACAQLQCEYSVSVIKITQSEYVSVNVSKKSAKTKSKKFQSSSSHSDTKKDDKMLLSALSDDEGKIKIYAIYDFLEHLVELKFEKNIELPRMLFQILGLIIKFQKYLTTITINQGIDMYSLHEINKFLPTCNVTDLCLDNTYLKEGNYSVLFENNTMIKRISLSRCRINDTTLEIIVSKLVYPLPASKTLVVLDLSTNRITDVGAAFIANALRSNRFLSYLNLSDNSLTDLGGKLLFDTLVNFQLTDEERTASKQRLMKYYLNKNEIVTQILKELRLAEQMKGKRKSVKPIIKPPIGKKGKALERECSSKGVSEVKSFSEIDSYLYDRACNIAESQMGSFNDPFSTENLVTQDGIVYCLGNNTLCYLNLSYNNLTYISLKILSKVVVTQKLNRRKPAGLINIQISGNLLPVTCTEMMQIEALLNTGISDKNIARKRPGSKSISSVR